MIRTLFVCPLQVALALLICLASLALPLRSGKVLVAIGALHLHGGKGLLALLRADGYRVVKVW